MFRRLLIANRGEIAVRIIRACRQMGITSIAVYSDADADSMHVALADESICIGPASPTESYLHIPGIIAAAEICDTQAIHPGYGFLSENAKFAQICEDHHIGFIGPSPDAIAMSGDKSVCRDIVKAVGVPVVPGSDGLIHDAEEAREVANEIGFPVLVKASAGGGGKGMRIAHNDVALLSAFSVATAEAEANFGDGSMYLEKYIENARHIEVQILADQHGKVISLGERECSIQRRHQKLIEETPSIAITPSVRSKMMKAAIKIAKAVKYSNAGTVEFLYDDDTSNFYFIEFNARIQVEHPVTEEVIQKDLVVEQIRIASGEPLGYNSLKPRGHSIEARINAEDPARDFQPTPGTLNQLYLPGGPGIRVDTHIRAGYTVPMYYDSLLAKIVAWGETRDQAIERLAGACDEFRVQGIETTAGLCAKILRSGRFRRGDISVNFVEQFMQNKLNT
ncbi:MAG: acetyl-CoA carboxylase biotin carboxylase subunit [Candidatus Hydrogenedentota bacterium]